MAFFDRCQEIRWSRVQKGYQCPTVLEELSQVSLQASRVVVKDRRPTQVKEVALEVRQVVKDVALEVRQV